MEYLMWYYKKIRNLGYCSDKLPSKELRIGPKGKIRYFYRVRTFSYPTFNWIHDSFYKEGHKRIPLDILDIYLTPEALAIWVMDDGTKSSNSIRFCTHSFTKEDILKLSDLLLTKYNIKTSLHKQSILRDQYMLYVKQESFNRLKTLILPHKHKSKLYKQNLK